MEVVITNIKDEMFAKIQEKCREKISIEWMVSTKTAQGNTRKRSYKKNERNIG